jgi:sugar phosphate permease
VASITSRAIAAEAIRLADHTRHQTALRLLPFLFVLYVTNYLDRTSLAYAAIGMKRDLGFSDSVTGLGLGVFFISYVALQIPGAILVERWSARGMISTTMIVWGTMTALTALVHTPAQLYGARLVLGAAEAGFFPGVIVYLSHWFMQADRAKIICNVREQIEMGAVEEPSDAACGPQAGLLQQLSHVKCWRPLKRPCRTLFWYTEYTLRPLNLRTSGCHRGTHMWLGT